MSIDVGRFGVWLGRNQWNAALASATERLGYGALWIGGSPPADLELAESLLSATDHVVVGTSIVNVWQADPAAVGASYHRLEERFPGRFLLGIGVGHPERTAEYLSPYRALVGYLDALDTAGVPVERRVVAALGPRVLKLAGERAAGAIPYLTTPAHTRQARQLLGDRVFLAPEHKVVVDTDDARARDLGRQRVANPYLGLRNYVQNLLSLGYSEDDVANGGSDRLVDDLALHGEASAIAARLGEHFDAGADHVVVQPLASTDDEIAGRLGTLAAALSLNPR